MTTTLQRMQRLLARRFDLDEREMTPECTLDRLGIDSLATLELMFEIEDEFAIRFPEDAPRALTLGELVARVDEELANEPRPCVMNCSVSSGGF